MRDIDFALRSAYFDGVYKNSSVWINGHFLGNRPNGFTPIQYELSKHLKFKAANTIRVKVDHTGFADSRWYTGSGIYRNVYLLVKDPVHIANGVFSSARIMFRMNRPRPIQGYMLLIKLVKKILLQQKEN